MKKTDDLDIDEVLLVARKLFVISGSYLCCMCQAPCLPEMECQSQSCHQFHSKRASAAATACEEATDLTGG